MKDKFYTWGKTATELEDPGQSYVETGYEQLQWLIAKYYNHHQNQSDRAVNELLSEGPNVYPDTLSEAEYRKVVSHGNFLDKNCWSMPYLAGGYIKNTGKKFSQAAIVFIDEEPHIAAIEDTVDGGIFLYHARTNVLVSSVAQCSTITNLLSTAGTDQWVPSQIVSDGTDMYVSFYDSTSVQVAINAITYDPDTDTWSKKSGWPTNGFQPSLGSATFTSRVPLVNLAVANDTSIVYQLNFGEVGAVLPSLGILSMVDGNLDSYGYGDGVAGATKQMAGGLTSDGTNVYFTYTDTGGPITYLGTATIANVAVGSGISGYPATIDTAEVPNITHVGGGHIVAFVNQAGSEGPSSYLMRLYSPTSVPSSSYTLGDDVYSGSGRNMSELVYNGNFLGACFDGKNLWVTADVAEPSSTNVYPVIHKIPVASLRFDPNSVHYFAEAATETILLSTTPSTGSSSSINNTLCIFDGRDVLSCGRFAGVHQGFIYKVPFAQYR